MLEKIINTDMFKKCIHCKKEFYIETMKQCDICEEFYCIDCYESLFIECEKCNKNVCECCTNIDLADESNNNSTYFDIICIECHEKGFGS